MLSVANFPRAKRELAYAFEHVPFYRAHLESAGLVPGAITRPEDMLRVPPTRKVHYRRNFPAGVIARGHSLDEPFVYRNQSSGTEGDRLVSVAHSFTLAARMATCLTVHPSFTFLVRQQKLDPSDERLQFDAGSYVGAVGRPATPG